MSHRENDDYGCIGGEGWYHERCSENFLVSVPKRLFSDIPPLAAPFRDDCSIRLGNEQQLRLPENDRKEYYENIKNFTLRASSGIVSQRHDSKYESSTFQELSMLVHVSTPYEEAFIRRNAVLKFQQRILRSAQIHHASLKPAYPGSVSFCTCGNATHLEYCPLHDIYDDEKEFLYPLLEPGDRVKIGPDWQWGNQGGGGEGTVVRRKEWKGIKDKGICVHWDNGEDNVYRYGADYCYDVIESNPMQKYTYVPLGGFVQCSETYWSRYVPHYIQPSVLLEFKLNSIVSYDRLAYLLPDFDLTASIDESLVGQSLHTLETLVNHLESEYMKYLHLGRHSSCFHPSTIYSFILHTILYPFQIYLLSQAEGDTSCQRSESLILEGYVMFLISSSIRIIQKTVECIIHNPNNQSYFMTSLNESILGALLSYLLSMLYLGQYSHHVASTLRTDLNDLTNEWCQLLKVCEVDKAIKQNKEDLLVRSVYDENYYTIPISLPWYMTVLHLLVTTNTKYHYSCLYFNYVEPREDICCLLESYIFSGGLIEYGLRDLLTYSDPNTTKQQSLLRSLFDNDMSDYDFVHRWLDSHFPEPAWKRKRQPIHVSLELKLFVVLVHLCNYSDLFYDTYNELMESQDTMLPIPSPFIPLWRQVITFREHLRKKKQEFVSHSTIGFNHALSQMIIPTRRISSTSLIRSDSSQFRSEQQQFRDLNQQSLPSERRVRLRKLITHVGMDMAVEEDDNKEERKPIMNTSPFKRLPTPTKNMEDIKQLAGDEETELMFTSNYEDYVDQIIQKFDVLMSLNKPWDLNENQDMENCILSVGQGQQRILASLKKTSSLIIEEKGVIPSSIEELVCSCVSKFLYGNSTVTCKHLRESLQHRTENAQNKKRLFDEGLTFLKTISVFPEAARLFLLGLFHETTVFSNLCVGGYHNNKRRRDGAYGIDYLENCEGASHSAMQALVSSLVTFCEYLKFEFSNCVNSLQWRYGSAIVWFLTTVNSPKLPYFPLQLGLLEFFEEYTWKLDKWYEMTNDYSKDILISPGIFWDSLSQKPINFASSHFHRMLADIQENGSYVNIRTTKIPGIFPVSIMVLANCMRLGYTITIIQQVSDYVSRSRASPAQNNETLYNWTVTDVSNLFIRQSIPYLTRTYLLFASFMKYFDKMKNVLKERCDSWQPFAPISYHNNESGGNPYCCVKYVDEKNIMRGMIATDMLISAAEATISSYLALLVFIIKTRSSFVLPWKEYGNTIWEMLYFSPRHQKLATMLLQSIIPSTDYIPPVFEDEPRCFSEVAGGTPDTDSIIKNPFLHSPVFPQNMETTQAKREAFVYYLLHLASHSDGCPGALVGERTSCALCCDFFPFIYNTLCPSSACYNLPNKAAFIEEVLITRHKIFVSPCKMRIRPEGHTASFCSLVFAEEIVYLLRRMMSDEKWHDVMLDVFDHVLSSTADSIIKEKGVVLDEQSSTSGFHAILRKRTPWFCISTAVLKVLGAITPRMYAGCRIRIHEFLMEGENDVSTLIHTAYQSHGTGSIIKYHRSMGEALVLMDKIDTPVYVNNYVFDVVDRIEPPHDSNGRYSIFLQSIIRILTNLPLCEELFTLPAPEMPFFNTTDLPLSPSELQNVIMYLYCIRCINHMVISNDKLASELSPAVIHELLAVATRPLPCNVSFNTLIIRQYFNWFIEYLVDTYTGSARLLPMDLQTEEDGEVIRGRDKVDRAFGLSKEEEEEVRFDEGEEHGPKVIRNEKRMRMAEELSVITKIDTTITYAALQSFNDHENEALTFLMELTPENRNHICSPIQIEQSANTDSDESILTDMELGIRQLHIDSNPTEKTITEETLSQVIPPFTGLQKLTAENVKNMNSIYGVVASVTDKNVLYSPIPETGVIAAVNSRGVMLSFLNADSGILEESTFPTENVSLHKHRLLYYLGNVRLLRGVVGRICCTLAMKYVRELIICLLYYLHKNKIDVLDYWQLVPGDLVQLTKFTYVTYMNNLILNPSKQNHVTLVACLFKILKGCIKKIVISSPRGNLLLNALMNGAWDDEQEPQASLDQYKRASLNHLPHSHGGSISSIQVGNEFKSCYTVTSLHPMFSRAKYYDKIVLVGVEGLRVVFDKRCCLDPANASLTFFKDENHSQVLARFTGDSSNFCAFTIRGNTLRFLFESTPKARPTWGYAFIIQPFEHVRWNGDVDVLESSCFDWNCFALDLTMDISRYSSTVDTAYFNRAMHNMIGYLRSAGMPFKSRVVELLIKMQGLGKVLLHNRPDLSGIYDKVISFSEGLDSKSIVPSQLPLLIEFLASYSNAQVFESIEKRADSVFPPFSSTVDLVDNSLRDCIDSVYILTRCLYYLSYPPLSYLNRILHICHKEWNETEYTQILQCYKRFNHKLDIQLIGSLTQKCSTDIASMLDYDVSQFSLDEDDKARFYALSSFSNTEVRMRLALIQFYNQQLLQVMHLIDLGAPKENDANTLGKYISLITGYIFPSVKEYFLELSINQTVYHGKDCYPVVELDNRRVFTDMEKTSSFEEEKNALTSQCTFAQLYRQMKNHNTDVLRAKLDAKDRLVAIKYKGEQGLDWGGLYHDTIERCVEDLFSDHIDLFILCPNSRNEEGHDEKYLPNPKYRESSDILAMYTFVGNLIGISLRTKQLMSIELCSAIWKTIVGDKITAEDVEAVDSEFMNALKQVKEYKESDGKEDFVYLFGLTYSVADSAGNDVELIPSGGQVSVTFENRLHYYDLALDYRLNEWKQAAEAIAAGVYALIPQRALSLFTWEQLERAVKGVPDVSVETLKLHTIYEGWSETHPVVQRFWKAMRGFSNKDRSQFLRFSWGRSRLPKSDPWPRPFKLKYSEAGDEMLPIAHTCFFQLDLPQYSTDAIMRERLLVAIHFGAGEFMLK